MVQARLLGESSGRDPRIADVDQQALGRVEQSRLSGRASRGLVGRLAQGATRSRTRTRMGFPCDGVMPMSSPQRPLIPRAGTVVLYVPGPVCCNRVETPAISMSSMVNVV